MFAKSFIGDAEGAARRFYATVLKGEVSDDNVRAYLDAASQIEAVWSDLDERLADLLRQGVPPWEAYEHLGTALAFIRAARTYQVFVRELLAADAAMDPAAVGYLPRLTFDQANAFSHQIQPNIQRALAALGNPAYVPSVRLPLLLRPHIQAEGACPLAHLRGTVAAAQEVREWAAGLIAQYDHAIHSTAVRAPARIEVHLTALYGQLALADSELRYGADLVGAASARQRAARDAQVQADEALWRALKWFFLLNQAVALPALLDTKLRRRLRADDSDREGMRDAVVRGYRDRGITARDLWKFSSASARAELKGTLFGDREMAEMCRRMGHTLPARAQCYLDDVAAATHRGDAYMIGAMATCPWEPIYRTRCHLEIADREVPVGHEFHWDFSCGRVEARTHFARANAWLACPD